MGIDAPRPRQCQQCGAADHVHIDVHTFGENNKPVESHFVRIELMFLDEVEGAYRKEDVQDPIKLLRLQRRGWSRITINGRPAMQRWTCIDCLNANEVSRKIWRELRESAARLESKQHADENFYAVLCEVED